MSALRSSSVRFQGCFIDTTEFGALAVVDPFGLAELLRENQ